MRISEAEKLLPDYPYKVRSWNNLKKTPLLYRLIIGYPLTAILLYGPSRNFYLLIKVKRSQLIFSYLFLTMFFSALSIGSYIQKVRYPIEHGFWPLIIIAGYYAIGTPIELVRRLSQQDYMSESEYKKYYGK